MLEKELSFADLSISLSELYEAMGYADAVPDEAVEKEVRGVLGRVEERLQFPSSTATWQRSLLPVCT